MNLRQSILSFLQVRESESKLVSRLFIFEFFQGAALAIVFTTAITLFLQQLPIQDLPKVFVLSAFLLWVAAYIYHRLEKMFSAAKLVLVVLLFNMTSILFFLMAMSQETQPWFLFAFLATFNILYLLNNLEFWGLASLLFDVRQSKRLFSVVSASDLPAKLSGYLLTALLVPMIGTENLLWVALAFMLISLLLYKPLVRVDEIRDMAKSTHVHHTNSVKTVHKVITGNSLILILALISFFSLCCLIVVNIILYGYIKHEFKNDKEMQSFFAIFLAIVRLITLVVKTGVTNRLADKLGIQRSLIITPAILLVICIVEIFFSMKTGSGKSTLYIFGVMALVTDVLRMAILTPVMLAAMQPLPTHQRLSGHTILKGLMDPFAFLAMGSLLWFMSTSGKELDLAFLGFILAGLIVCWMVTVLFVDKHYATALTTAIRNRTLNARNISITDKESLDILLEKIKGGNETEAIGVLNLVASNNKVREDFIAAALQHSSATVKKYALLLLQQNNYPALLPQVKAMPEDPLQKNILPEIIQTISKINPAEDLSSFIGHEDLPVAAAAVDATLMQKGEDAHEAMEKLQEWLASPNKEEQITGLRLAANAKVKSVTGSILALMHHENADVRKAAMEAAAKHGDDTLTKNLFTTFLEAEDDKYAMLALSQVGDKTLHSIQEYLLNEKCEGVKSRKLFSVLSRSTHPEAANVLRTCITSFPKKSTLIIPAIIQKGVEVTEDRAVYEAILVNQLNAAGELLFSIHFLESQQNGDQHIRSALYNELADIQKHCLELFTLLYDAKKIKKVKEGLSLNTKESIANALELLYIHVPHVYAGTFVSVFEHNTVQEKYQLLKKTVKEPMLSEEVITKNILFDVNYSYNYWTKACVLYSFRNRNLPFSKAFIHPFTLADSGALREIATVLIAQH
ncbi:MAG TPA: MFS transporter [Agriterribacter sp.]|nr:MFS transporter [Agriterribacter sp.]